MYRIILLLLCTIIWADTYSANPETIPFKDQIFFKASFAQDEFVSRNQAVSFFLEIENRSPYTICVEPDFNSWIEAGQRKYYRKPANSANRFISGSIEPGKIVKGFVYFVPFAIPKKDNRFYLTLNNIRINDNHTAPFKIDWTFIPVSGSSLAASVKDSSEQKYVEETTKLDYSAQLSVLKSDPGSFLNNVKVEMPAKALRGQNLNIRFFMPTGIDAAEVTAVFGIANYVTLHKEADGIFAGYFRVPEVFDPGNYVASFFIRTADGKKYLVQKSISIE